MPDIQRTLSEILALLADNTGGNISPQDLRDAIVSVFANYALISVVGGATAQTLNVTPGTFDKVTGFTTDVIEAGALDAQFASNQILANVDGVFLILWSVSFSGSNNSTQEGRIRVNGSEITNHGRWERKIGNSGDVGSASCFAIANVSATDHIDCVVAADGVSDEFTPQEMSLAVIKIG